MPARPLSADTVEKLVWRSGRISRPKFGLIKRPLLNATQSGDDFARLQNRLDQFLNSFSTESARSGRRNLMLALT